MRAVMLEVPEHLLEERRRRGEDVRDEMWEGVLHMVSQPLSRHQRVAHLLAVALEPVAEARELWSAHETSVFRPDAEEPDYRVPDLVYADRRRVSERGIEGQAELVVEIRSPGDETDEKVPWYLARGGRTILVIDRDTLAVDLFGEPEPLGLTVTAIDASNLRVAWEGGEADIVP